MSHRRCWSTVLACFTLGILFLSDWQRTPAQEKGKDPAAKPTSFPEPTQFDSKPFTVRIGDDVLAVAYSPDGTLLAIGSADKSVRLFDPASGKLLAVLQGHSDAIAAVAFSRDGLRIASASYDKTIRVWDVAARKETAVLNGHQNAVLSVAF